jgi:hypothetical protein
VFDCFFVFSQGHILEARHTILVGHGVHFGVIDEKTFVEYVCLVEVFFEKHLLLDSGSLDLKIVQVVEVMEHELDILGIVCVQIPLGVFRLSAVDVGLATGQVNDTSLGLLEAAARVGVLAACKAGEFGLGAYDGFVDFVDVRAAGDCEICMFAAKLETKFYLLGLILFQVGA